MPVQYDTELHIRLPRETLAALTQLAQDQDRPVSWVVRRVIDDALKQRVEPNETVQEGD